MPLLLTGTVCIDILQQCTLPELYHMRRIYSNSPIGWLTRRLVSFRVTIKASARILVCQEMSQYIHSQAQVAPSG